MSVRILVEGVSDQSSIDILLRKAGKTDFEVQSVGRAGMGGNAELRKPKIINGAYESGLVAGIDRLIVLKDSDGSTDAEMNDLFAEVRSQFPSPAALTTMWLDGELETLMLSDWTAVMATFGVAGLQQPANPPDSKLVIEWLIRTKGAMLWTDFMATNPSRVQYRVSVHAPLIAEKIDVTRLASRRDWQQLLGAI